VPRRIGVGELELVVNLGAEDGYAARGLNAQLHAVAIDGEHGNRDVFAKQQTLVALAAQNEHVYSASVLTCAIVWVVV